MRFDYEKVKRAAEEIAACGDANSILAASHILAAYMAGVIDAADAADGGEEAGAALDGIMHEAKEKTAAFLSAALEAAFPEPKEKK